MQKIMDPTRGLQTRRMVVAVFITIILLGVGLLIGLQASFTQLGNRAWQRKDYVASEQWHNRAVKISLVDRWMPLYNRGVANFGKRSWPAASSDFAAAAHIAPKNKQCQIRLNWSWSLEAAGDELARTGDKEGARERWLEATTILAEEKCSNTQTNTQSNSSKNQDQKNPGSPEGGEHTDSADGTQAQQQEKTLDRLDKKTSEQNNKPDSEDPAPPDSANPEKELGDRNNDAQQEWNKSNRTDNQPSQPKKEDRGKTW